MVRVNIPMSMLVALVLYIGLRMHGSPLLDNVPGVASFQFLTVNDLQTSLAIF